MNKPSSSAKRIRKPRQRAARSEDAWLGYEEIQISCNRFFASRGMRLEFNRSENLRDGAPTELDELLKVAFHGEEED